MTTKKYPSIIFKERIKSIKEELKNYCDETVALYRQAINLIDAYDENTVSEISEKSKQLDIAGHEIERSCIRFVAVEQPLAGDLMYIESAIRVISHVKRIAYLCSNIANATTKIQGVEISQNLLNDLNYMADYVQIMLTTGFGAFTNQDLTVARELEDDDDKVDDLFDSILEQVIDACSQNIDSALGIINILFIARYLERIGDRVVNIGDRVIFINTNKRPRIEHLKEEEES